MVKIGGFNMQKNFQKKNLSGNLKQYYSFLIRTTKENLLLNLLSMYI